MFSLSGIRRPALIWGGALGLVIVALDTVMTVFAPAAQDTRAISECLNLILNGIFYSLAGYLAAALTGARRQGFYAGLIAGLLVALLGFPISLLLAPERPGLLGLLGYLLSLLLLNLALGGAFGYLGALRGSKE
jgi:hypothetical protein